MDNPDISRVEHTCYHAGQSEASIEAKLAADSDNETAGDKLELSEEMVRAFVDMELRRRSRDRNRDARVPGSGTRRAVELPQQEDEASREAIEERVRLRKRQEVLYGSKAPEVRALEAALNQVFDRFSDGKPPALWPSVPLV